ncbi:MAG: S-adenosylmethionine:tRNA ribosyltransferase-isomerase [Actinomycetota bacterium]|nr:S-adenosylmethionine:tRNA ribosyltransferase-isomerase [Actinomycetota bacterium]
MKTLVAPSTTVERPQELSATEPPEERGLQRDGVRLLVAEPEGLHHAHFGDLGRFLRSGDLIVVNTSATLAAAVEGNRRGDSAVVVHFSTPDDDGTWVVELRASDGSGPVLDGRVDESIRLPGGVALTLLSPRIDPTMPGAVRLWKARISSRGPVEEYLAGNGRPITYGYTNGRWDLAAYQTIFAREPGSAEMPGAGRPFTDELVTELVTKGVALAPVLLHAGVSSLEAKELPAAERFRVPEQTAGLVNHIHRAGGRVIAVGTTVTRALETVARPDGSVSAGEGWTELVLGPPRPARVVDGLISGWHPPGASHLLLLEAVAGPRLVEQAYASARAAGYLWHEFGDSALLLPSRPSPLRVAA